MVTPPSANRRISSQKVRRGTGAPPAPRSPGEEGPGGGGAGRGGGDGAGGAGARRAGRGEPLAVAAREPAGQHLLAAYQVGELDHPLDAAAAHAAGNAVDGGVEGEVLLP